MAEVDAVRSHAPTAGQRSTPGIAVTSRRVLNSVLHNCLATFASRCSDHCGYWLFGQLPADLDRWEVDLCAEPPVGEAPLEVAKRLAVRRFREQLAKVGFGRAVVSAAVLSCSRGAPAVGMQGEFEVAGHRVELRVRVVTDRGGIVDRRRAVFVATHDPGKERRRSREHWGPSS